MIAVMCIAHYRTARPEQPVRTGQLMDYLPFEDFWDLMRRGGVMMWPLLALSVLAGALAFERAWFWITTNGASRQQRVLNYCNLLRAGDRDKAAALAEGDRSVYGRTVRFLISQPATVWRADLDAVIGPVVETERSRIERFMATLSTIITAAPMIGILGTVLGIITSFQGLGVNQATSDPRAVSSGIAEALLTTAAGLFVALVVLFPYNAFRVQVDRTIGRIEMIVGAAEMGANAPVKTAEPHRDAGD